jgi:hypothetical protein
VKNKHTRWAYITKILKLFSKSPKTYVVLCFISFNFSGTHSVM